MKKRVEFFGREDLIAQLDNLWAEPVGTDPSDVEPVGTDPSDVDYFWQ